MENNLNINWYPGHMAKTKRLITENLVIIDLVFELVDARIPNSSRIPDLDNTIRKIPKMIIMTKTDLADKEQTIKWKEFYEKKGFTVMDVNLMSNNIKPLIKKILEETKQFDEKRINRGLKIRKKRILVVGIPNVGKSTLINRLVSKKVTNVGNKPGVTKSLGWIRIDKNLELLDTPGILWPKIASREVALNLSLFTAIKEEVLPKEEVAKYALSKLQKLYPKVIFDKYNIEKDDDFIISMEKIAKKRGCYFEGKEIDYDRITDIVINDFKSGAISGITFDRIGE